MNTASTDMGNVSHVVRAIHPYLAIDTEAVNHQAAFATRRPARRPLTRRSDGAILLAQTTLDIAATEEQ